MQLCTATPPHPASEGKSYPDEASLFLSFLAGVRAQSAARGPYQGVLEAKTVPPIPPRGKKQFREQEPHADSDELRGHCSTAVQRGAGCPLGGKFLVTQASLRYAFTSVPHYLAGTHRAARQPEPLPMAFLSRRKHEGSQPVARPQHPFLPSGSEHGAARHSPGATSLSSLFL